MTKSTLSYTYGMADLFLTLAEALDPHAPFSGKERRENAEDVIRVLNRLAALERDDDPRAMREAAEQMQSRLRRCLDEK